MKERLLNITGLIFFVAVIVAMAFFSVETHRELQKNKAFDEDEYAVSRETRLENEVNELRRQVMCLRRELDNR